MEPWNEFVREQIRHQVNAYAKSNDTDHRTAWHHLYGMYADQGGVIPDAKNKLQAFEGPALERLLAVAKTI